MHRRFVVPVAVVLLASLTSTLAAQRSESESSATLVSQQRARAVLDAVLARHSAAPGGPPPTLVLWQRGVDLQRFQSPSPEPPFDTLRSEQRIAFDESERSVAIEYRAWWPDFVRHVNQVATPAGGVVQDFNSGTTRSAPDLTTGAQSSLRVRVPRLLVREALDRPLSLRHLGAARLAGATADVVAYVRPDGTPVSLYVARSDRRILAHEVLTDDLRFGRVARRTEYHDYFSVDGIPIPRRVTVDQGPLQVSELRTDSASRAPAPLAAAMAALDSVDGPHRPATTPSDDASARTGATVDTVAQGIYLVTPEAAPNYRVLFVDLGRRLLAVEAPVSEAATRAAIGAIRDELGPLPIAYAAITHHHSDHSAGVAAYAAEGATLLVTPGNAAFVRDLVAAASALEGQGETSVRVETVNGRFRIDGASDQVILQDVGPNPHAREHLVALLPDHGLVFQGDLVQFPHDGGVEAARPQSRSLVELIDRLDWQVRRIAGVHGRIGTMDDLAAALRAAEEGR